MVQLFRQAANPNLPNYDALNLYLIQFCSCSRLLNHYSTEPSFHTGTLKRTHSESSKKNEEVTDDKIVDFLKKHDSRAIKLHVLRPKEKICVFPVTSPKKLG